MRPGLSGVFLGVALCALVSPQQRCGVMPGLPELPVVSRGGDVTLGGLFSLHDAVVETRPSFTAPPEPARCTGFNFRTFRWMQTMIFAIEKINSDAALLPNITLGYEIYDSCSSPLHALRTAVDLMGGAGCGVAAPAVIGDGGSTLSMVVAHFLGILHLPQVSYFSSCACLSDKKTFPTFLRTMPSDLFQVNALARLVERFGWTWVGTVAGDDAYGRGGAQIFEERLRRQGACVALREVIPRDHAPAEMTRLVGRVRASGARVVLVFALEHDARALFTEALRQNLSGIQWLGSEAWITAAALATPELRGVLQGSVGFAVRRVEMPALRPFLLRLRPSAATADAFVREFWEETFGCSLRAAAGAGAPGRPPCNGSEDLARVKSIYSDVSQLRISYNVYKAVYAIAHALDVMRRCVPGRGPFSGGGCPDPHGPEPWQLLHYLKQVDFTNEYGEQTRFDRNGDAVAMYDLINLQVSPAAAAEVRYVTVGTFHGTESAELLIEEEKIVWSQNQTQVPVSVCSTSCSPGTRRAIRPGSPVCCFDCVLCAAGEVSNTTDAIACVRCDPEFWSNLRRDACIPKLVDYLSYSDPMGVALLVLALLGSCATLVAGLVFARGRRTPLVRANNTELSFLILGSLWLCFLCALAFVGRPTAWSCQLRHTAFGVAFCLCLSCVLGKTAVVLRAFRATAPGSAPMRWFRPPQLRALIFLCTLVQVGICGAWLSVAPPTPRRLVSRESARIVLLCDVGSVLGFSLVLGYIGVLAAVCFILAFLGRKLPDRFNEAKFITFSMLIFCAVWTAFVPAYISSPGKYTVAVEIFAILASSYGLLLCIFAPKCYIILLRPEKNTKKSIMART